MYRSVLALLFASVLLLSGCAVGQQTVPKEKSGQEATMDESAFDRSDDEITYMDTTENVIYLAGGCFWGMEQLMQSIPGVIDAESGYANGTCEADADYKTVCKGETGFRETVRVELRPRAGEPRCAAVGLLLCDRPHGTKPTGQRPGQPVPDRRLLHQRKREGDGGAHRGDRARPQREVFRGDRPAQELLSRRGIPPELPRKESGRLLPHPARGDGTLLQTAHRPGRLSEARGRVHPGQADGGAVPRHAGERHGARLHGRVLGQI